MSSLFEIDTNIKCVLENGFNDQCVDLETGEIVAEKVQDYLNGLSIERDAKLENIGLFIKNLEAESEAIKQEETNLKARRQQKERKVESLKEYLKNSLLLFNQNKFETSKLALSFRKSLSVEVEDVKQLPVSYIKEKVEYVADKVEIKKALQNGIEVKGAVLVENQNLQIK